MVAVAAEGMAVAVGAAVVEGVEEAVMGGSGEAGKGGWVVGVGFPLGQEQC